MATMTRDNLFIDGERYMPTTNSRRYINLATIGRAPFWPLFPNLWTFRKT
jgi:hypothetical protein